MKNSVTIIAALALAIGTSFVVAQTTPTQSTPTNTPPNSTPLPTGTGEPMAAPRTNMPTTGAMSATMPPDFNTLDKNRAGFVTQKDIASNPWLSKNFAMCDADHDGQVTRAEYSTCSQRP